MSEFPEEFEQYIGLSNMGREDLMKAYAQFNRTQQSEAISREPQIENNAEGTEE